MNFTQMFLPTIMNLESIISKIKEVNKRNVIKDNLMSDEFKTETIRDVIVKEFNKRYYNL